MNKSAMRIVYVVFGFQLLFLAVGFTASCASQPSEKAKDYIERIDESAKKNRIDENQFFVFWKESHDDRIDLIIKNFHTAFFCTIAKPVDEQSASSAAYQHLSAGGNKFRFVFNQKGTGSMVCGGSIGHQDDMFSFIDVVPVPSR